MGNMPYAVDPAVLRKRLGIKRLKHKIPITEREIKMILSLRDKDKERVAKAYGAMGKAKHNKKIAVA